MSGAHLPNVDVVAARVQAGSGPASLATTIRLMAGLELAAEGFRPGHRPEPIL